MAAGTTETQSDPIFSSGTTSIEKKSIDPRERVEFSCPQCEKSFQTSKRSFVIGTAHFQCSACQVQFRVDLERQSDGSFGPHALVKIRASSLVGATRALSAKEGRVCPQCGHVNPKLAEECLRCQVLFSRLDGMTAEVKGLGGRPSLIASWQGLMRDYDNLQKHLAFVDQCEDLQALPYALKKYSELREAQPSDPTAQKMMRAVQWRSFRTPRLVKRFLWYSSRWPWGTWLSLSPYIFALVVILIGLWSPTQRNLIGFGSALLFLVLGFRYLLKGGLFLRDLIKFR